MRYMNRYWPRKVAADSFDESLGPIVLPQLFNRLVSALTELMRAKGGTVNKYTGHRVMAVRGAPTAMPDHTRLAARSAKAISIFTPVALRIALLPTKSSRKNSLNIPHLPYERHAALQIVCLARQTARFALCLASRLKAGNCPIYYFSIPKANELAQWWQFLAHDRTQARLPCDMLMQQWRETDAAKLLHAL